MKKLVNSLLLFIGPLFLMAQADANFINHLATNNLAIEHKAYLTSLPVSDSVNYYQARYHLKYNNDSLFLNYFLKSKTISENDSHLVKEAGINFLNKDNKYTEIWFNNTNRNLHQGIWEAHAASLNPLAWPAEKIPAELQKSFRQYRKACTKKPIIAAVFSALLPGSGKLYAGKNKTFILTFLLNAAYAAQTTESALKIGPKNPFTIINAAAFGVFYLSNIYGSYKTVKDLRKERKRQFLNDAANFYN